MAELTFGKPQGGAENPSDGKKQVDVVQQAADAIQNNPVNDNGMSFEELNDANKIKVTIADSSTPLVILFGPPACGKTMTLIRLTRYLKSNGYVVKPITSFRPGFDKNYSEMCIN